MSTIVIETERLIMRLWDDRDIQPYYDINQDPSVTEYLRGPLTMEQVKDFIPAVNAHHAEHGFTLWAVELKDHGKLMGFIGLNRLQWKAHFTPAVEIGWRLGSSYWGKGYATEGAKAALEYGFSICQLEEIVAFTVPGNSRSMRVMEKIGMRRDAYDDFAHPGLPADHRLSHHVLYRIRRSEYLHKVLCATSR